MFYINIHKIKSQAYTQPDVTTNKEVTGKK